MPILEEIKRKFQITDINLIVEKIIKESLSLERADDIELYNTC